MLRKGQMKLGWVSPHACCFVFLLAVACGQSGKDDNAASPDAACASDIVGRQTLRGHYTISFEHWLYRPCGSNTVIWVDPNSLSQAKGLDVMSQALAALRSERDGGPTDYEGRQQPETIFMEIVADVSPLGVYGHLGELGQELKVIEVLSASPTSPSDCPRIETVVAIDPRPECQH
jgi:hypothetical protein